MRLNVPNSLTLARVLLVPPLVAAIVRGSQSAAILLGVATVMDVLDGVIARARGEITQLGQLLDPVVDKVVITSALVALVVVNRAPAWVVAAILARDLAVTTLRVAASRVGVVIAASRLGKRKMDLQLAAVFAAILVPNPRGWFVLALLTIAVLATFASGIDYFARFGALRREIRKTRAATGTV